MGTDILKWTQKKNIYISLRESNLECEEHGGERLEPDEPVQGEGRGGVVGPVVKGRDLIVLPAVNNILSLKAVLRIRDVYPGSRIVIFFHLGSQIPDPKTATKERGEKKFVVLSFFVATKITKWKIILILNW
jgi:hypothetical protein